MSVFDWLDKLVTIPGRLTSVAVEKTVCGADEVYDDILDKRQSDLNAQFKAVTDQQQIAINGGRASIASSPDAIVSGSGAIVTANAVAGYYIEFLKGSCEVIELEDNITVSDTVSDGEQKTIIYTNNTIHELTVTIPNNIYRTPDGDIVSITVPVGGYSEVSLLNAGGVIFARGC